MFKIQVNYVLRFGGYYIYLSNNEGSVYIHWVLLCHLVFIEIEIHKYMVMCIAISYQYTFILFTAYLYHKSILFLVFAV